MFSFDVDNRVSAAQGLPNRRSGAASRGRDAEHYNYFRDYDASIGRYLESDPLGVEGGLNTYLYVRGSPLVLSDPSGQTPAAAAALGASIGSIFPGLGTAMGAAIGFGIGSAATYFVCKNLAKDEPDKKHCSKATKWQLDTAGIKDEHEFKQGHAGRGRISQYDICACDDGTIVIRKAGQCGKSGPTIDTDIKWK